MAATWKNRWKLAALVMALLMLLSGTALAFGDIDLGDEADGSKIEGIHIHWITDDRPRDEAGNVRDNEGNLAGNEGSDDHKDHLFIATKDDDEITMIYQVEVEFSGQYDYKPGDITITVPAQVWHPRKYVDGVGYVDKDRYIGRLRLPIPKAPDKRSEFNYQIIGDQYVITNTQTVLATSKAMFQLEIGGLYGPDIVDMSECEPIQAHCEVVTNQGNIIQKDSEPIVAQIDTREVVDRAYKGGDLYEDPSSVPAALLRNLPAGANPSDYVYARWYSYVYHSGSQPFTLKIDDVLSKACIIDPKGNKVRDVTDGIFLGSPTFRGTINDAKDGFTADIIASPRYHSDTTTSNDHTIEMWSAYLKADMPAPKMMEEPIHYYMRNDITWTLTEADAKVDDPGLNKQPDVQKVTTKSAWAAVDYIPLSWQYPPGHFITHKYTERLYKKDYTYAYLNKLMNGHEVDMNFILESTGFGLPWTTKDIVEIAEDFDSIDESHFGVRGWRQITEDYQTFFNLDNSQQLTSRDFRVKTFTIGIPERMRYGRVTKPTYAYVEGAYITRRLVPAGSFAYIPDSTLPIPDIVVEYKVNGGDEWLHAATGTWGVTGQGTFEFDKETLSDQVTVDDATRTITFLPEDVTDLRYIFTSNVFGGQIMNPCPLGAVIWYNYTTMGLKPSDEVREICHLLYELSETPHTKFENDEKMYVDGWILPGDTTSAAHPHLDNSECKTCDTCCGLGLINYDSSFATLEGIGYGVHLTKHMDFNRDSVEEGGDNDVFNKRVKLHYSAELTEQSNISDRALYDEAVKDEAIPAETSGIWYDLLPEGVVPLLNTVRLGGQDVITNKYVLTDYKGSGRDLLVVHADLTPTPSTIYDKNTERNLWGDHHYLYFDALYSWEDIAEFGADITNYVAFETKIDNLVDGVLGTKQAQRGESDQNPRGGMNATTPAMPGNILNLLTDLDPYDDPNEKRFVYASVSMRVSVLQYAVSSLEKYVRDDLNGLWTTGLAGDEQVTVYEGHEYTYKLIAKSVGETYTGDIVILDTIENYLFTDPADEIVADRTKEDDYNDREKKKNWQGDWATDESCGWYGGQWRGTLLNVDVSQFVEMGIRPVIYYSTVPTLTFADSTLDMSYEESEELFSINEYDVEDTRYWTRVEPDENGVWVVPDHLLGKISAVALDARKCQDGTDFVLEPEQELVGLLNMRAPDDDMLPGVWNAKGAYAHKLDALGNPTQEVDWAKAAEDPKYNMYAYNNTRMLCTQNGLTHRIMIRNDYTRVGILPTVLNVEKQWKDQNNHDAIRPEEITVELLRRHAGSKETPVPVLDAENHPLTLKLDRAGDWKGQFLQVDIVDELGRDWEYIFKETGAPGYTLSVNKNDSTHFTLVNTHPNAQVAVKGQKVWKDGDDAYLRPDEITVYLLRDGKRIDTRVVRADADGEWKYDFGNHDRFEDGGREYVYTVEEKYVPKYVPSSDDYTLLRNTLYPFGDLTVEKQLESATAAARQKEFTFTLTLSAEQTPEEMEADQEPRPVFGAFAYQVQELQEDGTWADVAGRKGEISNGDTFTLLGGQRLYVQNLPSDCTYRVEEVSLPGFTLKKATDAEGEIHAGRTSEAIFLNEYNAKGGVQLPAVKKLTGHTMRRSQFGFQIIDRTPGSEYEGEVVGETRNDIATSEQDKVGQPIQSAASVTFGQLDFTHLDDGKDFYYEVSEKNDAKPGYTHDAKKYTVKVHVADNGDGTLTLTAVDTATGRDVLGGGAEPVIQFHNNYHAEGSIPLHAWKVLKGREIKDKEFAFDLYQYDPVTKKAVGQRMDRAYCNTQGEVTFKPLTFTEKDVGLNQDASAEYHYIITEVQGTDAAVNYSFNESIIHLTVYDNHDGTISIAQEGEMVDREYIYCDGDGEQPVLSNVRKDQYGNFTDYHVELETFSQYTYYPDSIKEAGMITDGFDPSTKKYWSHSNSVWRHATTVVGTFAEHTPLCPSCHGARRKHGVICSECQGSGIDDVKIDYGMSYGTFIRYVKLQGQGEEAFALFTLGSPNGVSLHLRRTACATTPCETCGGEGGFTGRVTVTGEATPPVFTNTLKNGKLKLTKQVPTGNGDPKQTFTFHIKLTGMDGDPVLPIDPLQPGKLYDSHGVPTKQSEPFRTSHSYSELDQTVPLIGINMENGSPDYGEMTFFRSNSLTSYTDPWTGRTYGDYEYAQKLLDGRRDFDWKGGHYFYRAFTDNTRSYIDFKAIIECAHTNYAPNVKSITMRDEIVIRRKSNGSPGVMECFCDNSVTGAPFLNVERIVLDKLDLRNGQIGTSNSVFQYAKKLKYIDISGLDLRGNKTITNNMFGVLGSSNERRNVEIVLGVHTGGYSPDYPEFHYSTRDPWEVCCTRISLANELRRVTSEEFWYDKYELLIPQGPRHDPDLDRKVYYTGYWRNVETYEQLTSRELLTEGNHGGTWEWAGMEYRVHVDNSEATVAMRDLTMPYNLDCTFTPRLYAYGKQLVALKDDYGHTFNLDGSQVTIPAFTYASQIETAFNRYGVDAVPAITLHPVWKEVVADEDYKFENGFIVKLKKDQSTELTVPAGTAYEVWEELPKGWKLLGMGSTTDSSFIKPLETSEAIFYNDYSPKSARVDLRATKLLDGKAPGKKKFTFLIGGYNAPGLTVQNTESGAVVFPPLTFTLDDLHGGTSQKYSYYIGEINQSDDWDIVYDEHSYYYANVTLTRNGDGSLSADVSYDTPSGAPPVFKNTTRPGMLQVIKQVAGDMTDTASYKLFDVELTLTNPDHTPYTGDVIADFSQDGNWENKHLPVDQNGVVRFQIGARRWMQIPELPTGTLYSVREVGKVPGWEMDPTEYTGTIHPISNGGPSQAFLTNTYHPKGSVVLEVEKQMVGAEPEDGKYTFVLKDGDKELSRATTKTRLVEEDGGRQVAHHVAVFDPIEIGEVGTFTYTITEVQGNEPGVSYSTEEITATVTATDPDGEGHLIATVVYSGEDGEGDNIITNRMMDGGLKISKQVVNAVPANADKAFTFTLHVDEATGAPIEGGFPATIGDVTDTVTLVGGEVTLALKNGQSALIQGLPHGAVYTVTEQAETGFTAAATGDKGQIQAGQTVEASFVNTYQAEKTRYAVLGEKRLEGAKLEAGQFTFELRNGEGYVVSQATNDENGVFFFAPMEFGPDDAGEHVFYVSEVNDAKPGFTYDASQYKVVLTVTDDGSGQMSVRPTYLVGDEAQDSLTFRNRYSELVDVEATKVWEDGDTNAYHPAIAFRLYAASPSEGRKVVGEKVIPVNAVGDALTVRWTGLPVFAADGKSSMTYSVEEVISEETKPLLSDYMSAVEATQNNFRVLNRRQITKLNLTARKLVDGRPATSHQVYHFELRDENGKLLETVANRGDAIVFGAIVYTLKDVGVHNYTIREVNDGAVGVAYDERVFTLRVEVSSSYDGLASTVSHISSSDGEMDLDEAVFRNTTGDERYKHEFTFFKRWTDDEKHPTPRFVLYGANGKVIRTADQPPRQVEDGRYVYWLRDDGDYYVVEEPMVGYSPRYENIAPRGDVTDRAYAGGTIVNTRPPRTGDRTPVAALTALMATAFLGLAALRRRRER